MVKSNIKDYLNIDKNKLAEYYSNHIPRDCIKEFNLPSLYIFNKLLDIFEIPKRSKSDMIKQLMDEMPEEWKVKRNIVFTNYRNTHSFTAETRQKISIGNKGKYKGGGSGTRISPLKGQSKETNEALRRMSEERKNKPHWTIESWNKRINTLRQHNTFNTSKAEKITYDYLLTIYPKEDIEIQYDKDPRYPYNCDFYIKSQDLFIELNNHFTHGPHPFNPNNEEDVRLLKKNGKKKQKHLIFIRQQ